MGLQKDSTSRRGGGLCSEGLTGFMWSLCKALWDLYRIKKSRGPIYADIISSSRGSVQSEQRPGMKGLCLDLAGLLHAMLPSFS